MLQLKRIPCYLYFGTEQKPAYYHILYSSADVDYLITKFNVGGTSRTFVEGGLTEVNPIGWVGNYLGVDLFNSNINYYRAVSSSDPDPAIYGGCYEDITDMLNKCRTVITNIVPANEHDYADRIYTDNGYQLYEDDNSIDISSLSGGYSASLPVMTASYNTQFNYDDAYLFVNQSAKVVQFDFNIYRDDLFIGNDLNNAYKPSPLGENLHAGVGVSIRMKFNSDMTIVTEFTIQIGELFAAGSIFDAFPDDFTLKGSSDVDIDIDNPYANSGTSVEGGGDGTLLASGLDSVDPAHAADTPDISAADLGFITMYAPSASQVKQLSNYMWSSLDLLTYKKLFSSPMDSIIGLAIVPVAPDVSGSKNVMFGLIDSGISMPTIAHQYQQVDCGSVSLEKFVGCFMDNDPYTKIQIYLPFIGYRQLSADDIIGGSIQVIYNIDLLTGACACFIEHDTRGVLYSYNGSCITNVPLTALNFSGAIQNAVTAIGSAMGTIAGMATGAAPITAMSAMGLATSAANTALNSKPQVQRSGNLGGSAGIMSILTPYVIIERPALSVPSNVEHFVGQTSNITAYLGNCSGFTMCEYVHIDGVSATSEEITEIEALLKAGVIL